MFFTHCNSVRCYCASRVYFGRRNFYQRGVRGAAILADHRIHDLSHLTQAVLVSS